MCTIQRNGESKLKQKLPTPTSRDNGIKTDVVVVVVVHEAIFREKNFGQQTVKV